jgi:hypothetical protein
MARSAPVERPVMKPAVAATVAGAMWGVAGYAALWGYTPLTVHRSFVVSPLGTVLLLPVRVVLWAIRFLEERVVGHPFELASGHGWIGVAAAAVGAGVAAISFVVVGAVVRRVRAARAAE